MLKIKQFVFNPFGECTYVIVDEETRDAIVVDPGMAGAGELRNFDEFVEKNKLNITGVVNTHLHLDHCFGDNYVRDKYGVKVMAHLSDAPLGTNIGEQARRFGMRVDSDDVTIDVPLKDGDVINLGSDRLEVIHTPGHSPGGICLYSPSGKFLIAGDTLFHNSVGRTDLQGGDHNQLIKSIKDKLLTLPGDTLVLSGHGDPTTIAAEKQSNPFVQ